MAGHASRAVYAISAHIAMCSELLRIPITWHGVPIFGFGVVLAIWLAIGAWALATTAKVAGWPDAFKAHLPTIVIVAGIVALFLPRYSRRRAAARLWVHGAVGFDHRHPDGSGTSPEEARAGRRHHGTRGGVVHRRRGGTRLFYIIEYWDSRIRQDTWSATLKNALSYTEGGLVIYGAFVGAMLGFAVYVWRRKLPALAMADLIAPSMMAGLALGGLGAS